MKHGPSFSREKVYFFLRSCNCSCLSKAGGSSPFLMEGSGVYLVSSLLSWRAACNPVPVPLAPFMLLALCAPKNTWPSDSAKTEVLHLTWHKALVSLRKKSQCVMLDTLVDPPPFCEIYLSVSIFWVFFDSCACHAMEVVARKKLLMYFFSFYRRWQKRPGRITGWGMILLLWIFFMVFSSLPLFVPNAPKFLWPLIPSVT